MKAAEKKSQEYKIDLLKIKHQNTFLFLMGKFDSIHHALVWPDLQYMIRLN